METTETPRTMTITKAAQYLGLGKRTLYQMLKDGRFAVDPIKGSNPRRWNKEDLDAWRGK